MPRTFTVEQANRTLPLVSRIVHDIVSLFPRWRACVGQIELLAADAHAELPDPRLAELEREVQALAAEIDVEKAPLEERKAAVDRNQATIDAMHRDLEDHHRKRTAEISRKQIEAANDRLFERERAKHPGTPEGISPELHRLLRRDGLLS